MGVLDAALEALPGADLAVFEGQRITIAVRAPVRAAALEAVLGDPSTWRRALPALVKAATVPGAPGAVAWELEIPGFNLEGRLRIARPAPHEIVLQAVAGDFAPGRFRFRLADGAEAALVVLEAEANVRGASWLFRHLCDRSPLGAPAITAAAAWVLVRATAALAAEPGAPAAPRPRAVIVAPSGDAPDPRSLGDPRVARLAVLGPLGLVRSGPSGRLAVVSLGFPVADGGGARVTPAGLASARWLGMFPGWRRIAAQADRIAVDADLPLADFDAEWTFRPDGPGAVGGRAVRGATAGARLRWDVLSDARPPLIVLTLAPRIEATGMVPRRFIDAEPLLEHAMALALVYVDAASVARALTPRSP